jgi:hypothetical protein
MDVRVVVASSTSAATLQASEAVLRQSVARVGVELRGMQVDVLREPDDPDRAPRSRRGRRRHLDTEA